MPGLTAMGPEQKCGPLLRIFVNLARFQQKGKETAKSGGFGDLHLQHWLPGAAVQMNACSYHTCKHSGTLPGLDQ